METEKETILIVDDQPYNLKLISTYLSKKYKVAIANNGENALEVLKNITPDLILLDVLMPGMNGLEVCKKIKDNTKTKDVPIIFLTAQNDPEFVVNGFTNGAVDYITKPFNPSEVFVRISSQLELKRAKAELQEANSKFDALNKQKDKLFSIISHDLKGPFAGIIGLCRSLIRDIESGEASIDKNTVLPPLSLMLQSGESAYKLLENLLTWSKTLSDRYELSLTNVPIKNLILQSIELHRSYATKKDITIKNDVNKEIVVLADLYMINTVIRNLIANAIKFTYPNGIITIQANVQGV
ncbi:MAG: hybrid sensor histidine kinase/response regulator [Leptospiraceae bacterium]|nr:hybrid sensor histidine kinase/response regulator [Leptospiraceae bacterium]